MREDLFTAGHPSSESHGDVATLYTRHRMFASLNLDSLVKNSRKPKLLDECLEATASISQDYWGDINEDWGSGGRKSPRS